MRVAVKTTLPGQFQVRKARLPHYPRLAATYIDRHDIDATDASQGLLGPLALYLGFILPLSHGMLTAYALPCVLTHSRLRMANRDRYSRWALVGAAVAMLGVDDYVVLGLAGPGVLLDVAHVYQGFGVPSQIAEWAIVLSCIAGGPACIMLGKLALRGIRLHPGLRGTLLAQLVVLVRCLGLVGTMAAIGWLAAVLYLAGDA